MEKLGKQVVKNKLKNDLEFKIRKVTHIQTQYEVWARSKTLCMEYLSTFSYMNGLNVITWSLFNQKGFDLKKWTKIVLTYNYSTKSSWAELENAQEVIDTINKDVNKILQDTIVEEFIAKPTLVKQPDPISTNSTHLSSALSTTESAGENSVTACTDTLSRPVDIKTTMIIEGIEERMDKLSFFEKLRKFISF